MALQPNGPFELERRKIKIVIRLKSLKFLNIPNYTN